MRGTKRLLVIDDEKMLLDLVSSALEEAEGYSVTAVADGESGLEEIRANPPDLVLLDLGLKGMSGWDVIDRLKDHPSPPPVIVISGRGDQEPTELAAAKTVRVRIPLKALPHGAAHSGLRACALRRELRSD